MENIRKETKKMKVHDTVYSTVVKFHSAVDAESATELKNILSTMTTPIRNRLIMDMEASSYLSADAVCVLLNDYRNSHYSLEFRNVSKDVGQLLDTAGLGNLIVL
jgi:anti-anti-sigma factor